MPKQQQKSTDQITGITGAICHKANSLGMTHIENLFKSQLHAMLSNYLIHVDHYLDECSV